MKTIYLILIILLFSACSSQDPCLKMYDSNYTNEWFHRGDERFQVYKTRTGRRFIYELNIDSTRFRRVYIKTTNESI
jgi:hypothetical protein